MSIHDPTSAAYKKARRRYLDSTHGRPSNVDADWTPFRATEKMYKARFPPPDLSGVLDLAAIDSERADEVSHGVWRGRDEAVEYREVPLSLCGRKAYVFPDTPGLVLLPRFVSPHDQRHLIRWALCDQARHPNETNLDTHYVLPPEGLWNNYLDVRKRGAEDREVTPRASLGTTAHCPGDPEGPRKLIANEPASADNYRKLVETPKLPALPSQSLQPASISALVPKLRWANIGWYYHWGTKQYDFTRGPGEISDTVREVCDAAVQAVPWNLVFGAGMDELDWGEHGLDWTSWGETYEPDAGIVNFYQTKDTLMAHVDRSEICATSPLVSISLGCAAVFLIGGTTRDTAPTPILLRSGDVVIMSGPACRRAYHGVPRILEGTLPPHFANGSDGADDWDVYEKYLRTTRINVNVRQVFPKGFDPSFRDHQRPGEVPTSTTVP